MSSLICTYTVGSLVFEFSIQYCEEEAWELDKFAFDVSKALDKREYWVIIRDNFC